VTRLGTNETTNFGQRSGRSAQRAPIKRGGTFIKHLADVSLVMMAVGEFGRVTERTKVTSPCRPSPLFVPIDRTGRVVTEPRGSIPDGTWLVGADVSPGLYRAHPEGAAYWARIYSENSLATRINS
jgi:hypothetical protein